jgi:hypothetical protein
LIGGVLDLLAAGDGWMPVAEDLVEHLLLELREEAGVEGCDLGERGRWPRLLSVASDEELSQPEAVWQWEMVTPLEEIAARLTVEEHSGGVIVDRREPLPAGMWEQLTPEGRHAWRIWSAGAK